MQLPQPHYNPQPEDPDWLRLAAQFHGHLGPWATAGLRLGAAALTAAAAPGYFRLRVTCSGPFEQPPRACFLDGLQVATGATWGKRNLHWQPSQEISVRLENLAAGSGQDIEGRVVTVRPSEKLLRLLGVVAGSAVAGSSEERVANRGDSRAAPAGGPVDHARLEELARRIAAMPEEQLVVVEQES